MKNNHIDYKSLGNRIQKARQNLNMTQEALAEAIGKSNEYISKIENGKAKPSLEVLASICIVLKEDIGKVLTGTIYDSPTYLKKDMEYKLKDFNSEKIKIIYTLADSLNEYQVTKKK